MADDFTETLPLADLHEHPGNLRRHGDRQLAILKDRFLKHGWYRTGTVARWQGMLTILCGHGITAAAKLAGAVDGPYHVREIDPDSREALDIMRGDNLSDDLAEDDETAMLTWLVEQREAGELAGSGIDDEALAELLRATEVPYSPNLTPDLQQREYSDEDVAHGQEKLDGQYTKGKELEAIICPKCGEEFYLDAG